MAPTRIHKSKHDESSWILQRMQGKLEERRTKQTLRSLTTNSSSAIDFSSNDYLGLARDGTQQQLVRLREQETVGLGSTGSRLLSGNSRQYEQLESYLASVHKRPAALLFNSGYDANLSVVSSLPGDVILYDEYCHNSLHMGVRLWQTANKKRERKAISFRHNDTSDCKRQLETIQKQKAVILVESVYSMDGDEAPLEEILKIAAQFDAQLVVDEAHGLGVMGSTGLVNAFNLQNHPNLLYTIYTFGKAAGCHGAVVGLPSFLARSYLINYGYPFIYSTALPPHSLVTIRCAYETMTSPEGDARRATLRRNVHLFRSQLEPVVQWYASSAIRLLDSTTPIQALMVPGNEICSRFCQTVYENSGATIRLYPIKSPTVPANKERVRVVLHAHNTTSEIRQLVQSITETLRELFPLAKL